jgi:ubiquitin carboxyl-terminal hydrolase 7
MLSFILRQLDIDRQTKHTTPIQMYDFFQNRVVVHFKPRFQEEGDKQPKPEFDLTLSKKMTYEQMSTRVGEHLEYDPAKLRFTTAGNNGQPKAAIRRNVAMNVAEMVQPSYATTPQTLLFYELLDISLQELETKRNVKITWMGVSNKEESAHQFLLSKTSSFHDVAEVLSKSVKLSADGHTGTGRIRMFNIVEGRKLKIFSSGETIREADVNDLYAEVCRHRTVALLDQF